MPCSWGILGCANIANKAARALSFCDNGEVVAVASRSPEKVQTFINNNKLDAAKVASVTYDELVAMDSVDAVYVPLPTKMHLEWVTKCAENGKHVLLEKPVAVSTDELEQMIAVCKKHNVIFMDGVYFMHNPRLAQLEQRLFDDPHDFCGDVERVDVAMTFKGSDAFLGKDGSRGDIRVRQDGDPLGAVGDLGWYCIRIGLVAFGTFRQDGKANMPLSVRARCTQRSAEGVPTDVTGTVFFAEDKSKALQFQCSFHHMWRQWAEITTSRKVLRIPDFVLPDQAARSSFVVRHYPESSHLIDNGTQAMFQDETVTSFNVCQEANMFRAFSAAVVGNGTTESCKQWPNISLLTQCVMDAIMQAIDHDEEEVDVKLPALL